MLLNENRLQFFPTTIHKVCRAAGALFAAPSLITFVVAGIFLLSGCGKDESAVDPDRLEYPTETARLVSHTTAGIVASTAEIRVRFVTPVIHKNLVGESIKKDVFAFEPALEGLTRWKDRQTVIFKPSTPMKMRRKYRGTLDMQALLPEHTAKEMEPLQFQFEVAGRELVDFQRDFELKTSGDPRYVYLKGKVSFSEAVDLSILKSAATLSMNGRRLKVKWTESNGGKSFNFKTEDAIERIVKVRNFRFNFDKNPLDMSVDVSQKFTLPALADLQVDQVAAQGDEGDKSITVTFSDDLDGNQDISGLISVSPAVTVELKAIGKKVIIKGDFQSGADYTVTFNKGIRSRLGSAIKNTHTRNINFAELKPQVQFLQDGMILPSANRRRIRFRSLNVSQVYLEIKKVFENNLLYFAQTEALQSLKTRNDQFDNYYVNRVGKVVHRDSLQLGPTRNEWITHELDLSKLIDAKDQGLYLIRLNFAHRDMLYGDPVIMADRRQRRARVRNYQTDPYSDGYLHWHAQIFKPIAISDIGITYKKAGKRHIIYTNDILNARPMPGTMVTLKTYQNQIVGRNKTDGNGYVEFEDVGEGVFLIEAERNSQRSFVEPGAMSWNLSSFGTEGLQIDSTGLQAFIYSERGVYRPGDPINLSVIVRNADGSFPDNHPVQTKIFNPKNSKAYDHTERKSVDGFYNFSFQGREEDLTGNWRVEVLAGSKKFYHTLKIETVVPFRLKVQLTPKQQRIDPLNRTLELTLNSKYLFGNPAANLKATVTATLRKRYLSFEGLSGYTFDNNWVRFRPQEKRIFSGTLNENGDADIKWTVPLSADLPSAMTIDIEGRVLEKGGRPNINNISVPANPFNYYAGFKLPDFRYGYARLNSEFNVNLVAVNTDGNLAAGRKLTCRIYRGLRYWWYQYNNYGDYQMRFKSATSTKLVYEENITSGDGPVRLAFTPEERGIYLIEVQDGSAGHTSSAFFRAYSWGDAATGDDADVLALKTDKTEYTVGDRALITFPAPSEGAILFSLEKGNDILESKWLPVRPVNGEIEVPVKLTRDMVPNVYASISIIQPHAQTTNDRPIRTYGVVPLNLVDPDTRQELRITMPDELRSNDPFEIDIATTDGRPTQFTIAVVDEGLLDLTRFVTPDPWQSFFRKQRLGVQSYDLYSQVIGAMEGEVMSVFSIGGGLESKYRESQLNPAKKRRFKPVSMFQGPLQTDGSGKARVKFTMPNYVGSVRVMVVSAKGRRYAHQEKTVPVKTELMLATSLPRVLGPGDKIVVPAQVFAMKKDLGAVTVDIALEGPLKLNGESRKTLTFSNPGDQDVFFNVEAQAAVGQGKVTIRASAAGGYSSITETDLTIRASSPRIYSSDRQSLAGGSKISITIPDGGIEGSNQASLHIRRRPDMNFGPRLMKLIRYPYGCLEQTTSAAFPQLYLKEISENPESQKELLAHVDENINAAIGRLGRFFLADGSYSYWPGNRSTSDWGTLYAGHFLSAARQKGYSVPLEQMNRWGDYLRARALNTRDNLMIRVYRVYLLALAGQPSTAAMNLLRENNLKDMTDTEKWMLAGAYKLAGIDQVANSISKSAGMKVRDFWEFGNTYGSTMRNLAMILDMQVLFENWTAADELARKIATALSSEQYYSTQTSAFMLLAMGRYLEAIEGKAANGVPKLKGLVTLPNGKKVPFDTDNRSFDLPLTEDFGKPLTVELDNESNLERAFVSLNWNGLLLKNNTPTVSKNIGLKVKWYDDDGMIIDPANVKQGSIIWGHFQVSQTVRDLAIEELALVQVLPAGWEIENTRLSGGPRPSWQSGLRLNREEYLDIRDDRVMWFFDMNRYNRKLDFIVKMTAVTTGEFQLPATLVEAMYNNDYQATVAGKTVRVTE